MLIVTTDSVTDDLQSALWYMILCPDVLEKSDLSIFSVILVYKYRSSEAVISFSFQLCTQFEEYFGAQGPYFIWQVSSVTSLSYSTYSSQWTAFAHPTGQHMWCLLR